MSRFTGPLRIEFSDKAYYALMLEQMVWEADFEGSGKFVVIPKGFTSDGMSVPRWLWSFMPPWGDKASRAAILHDRLREQIDNGTPEPCAPTYRDADRQFRLALIALDVDVKRAWLLWAAVRVYSLFINPKGP